MKVIRSNQWNHHLLQNTGRPIEGCFECGSSRSEAIKVGKFIKKQKSGILIEAMIAGGTSGILE